MSDIENVINRAYPEDAIIIRKEIDTITTECKRLEEQRTHHCLVIKSLNEGINSCRKRYERAEKRHHKATQHVLRLKKAEADLAYYHSIEYAAKLQAQMEPIVKERDALLEEVKILKRCDETGYSQFEAGRNFAKRQALKDHKPVKLQPGDEDGRD